MLLCRDNKEKQLFKAIPRMSVVHSLIFAIKAIHAEDQNILIFNKG